MEISSLSRFGVTFGSDSINEAILCLREMNSD